MIKNNGALALDAQKSIYNAMFFLPKQKYSSKVHRLLYYIFFSLLLIGCDNTGESGGRGVAVESNTGAEHTEQVNFGRYHALIVGINDYDTWPQLKYAQGDAADVRQILIEDYGFLPENVNYLENEKATRKVILSSLTSMLKKLGEDDNLLIYVAAHGQLDSLTENGFWIPVEGDLYDESSWIRFSTVVEKINAVNVKAKNILIVTDSCWGGALAGRSGPTAGLLTPDNDGAQAYQESLNRIAKENSRQVISSGGFEEVPDRSDFAELFKQQLRTNQLPKIDVEYLFFKSILPPLIELGVTRPIISKLKKGKNQQGQFIFVRENAQSNSSDAVLVTGNDTDMEPQLDSGHDNASQNLDPGRSMGENEGLDQSLEPNASQGRLIVQSNVSNDQVYIDGKYKGSSRLDIDLDQGSYIIRIIKEGYQSQEKIIVVAAKKTNNVDFKLQKLDVAKPKVINFNASQYNITRGQNLTLSWQTSDALKTTLNGKSIALSGATLEEPKHSKTYTLIATNSKGDSVETSLSINVEEPTANISLFDVSSRQLIKGDSTTLKWETANAETVEIKGIGIVDASGTKRVSPKKNTRYSLIVTSGSGSKNTKTITVQVSEPMPDIIKFVAQPTAITSGQKATLYWLHDNTTSEAVYFSNYSGKLTTLHRKKTNSNKKKISGRITVQPKKTTQYTLSVKSSKGESATKVVTVKVVPKKINRAIGSLQLDNRKLNLKTKKPTSNTAVTPTLNKINPNIKTAITNKRLKTEK